MAPAAEAQGAAQREREQERRGAAVSGGSSRRAAAAGCGGRGGRRRAWWRWSGSRSAARIAPGSSIGSLGSMFAPLTRLALLLETQLFLDQEERLADVLEQPIGLV